MGLSICEAKNYMQQTELGVIQERYSNHSGRETYLDDSILKSSTLDLWQAFDKVNHDQKLSVIV